MLHFNVHLIFFVDETGVIDFEFQGDPILWEVHVFQTRKFSGNMTESEEMRPQWWPENEVPFKQMWLDDEIWYPHMLKSKKFKGYFLFQGQEKILDHKLELLYFFPFFSLALIYFFQL